MLYLCFYRFLKVSNRAYIFCASCILTKTMRCIAQLYLISGPDVTLIFPIVTLNFLPLFSEVTLIFLAYCVYYACSCNLYFHIFCSI